MAREQAPPRDLYNRLIERGIPRDEIERVYRKLRARGYGESAARERLEASILAAHNAASRRPVRPGSDRRDTGAGSEAVPEHRRMEDFFPVVHPRLRRTINKWARAQRLLMVGGRERWKDFLSLFRSGVPDLVNPALLEALSRRKHYLATNPYTYSLATTLEALYQTSRALLGQSATGSEGERSVAQALSRRDPFGLEYLRRFAHYDEMLRRSLIYLEMANESGKDVEVATLARVSRELYRLVLSTEQVSRGKVDEVLMAAGQALGDAGKVPAIGLEDATAIFRISLDNLQQFKRELYPVMLRAIASFYEYETPSQQRRAKMLDFLGLSETDVLTVKGFHEQETERRERLLAEQQRLELESLERQKEAGFSRRFHGVQLVLGTLFPDSGIDDIEQRPYLLPYFDTRVFVSALYFDAGGHTVEAMGKDDPVQPLLVLHRIVDNLLSAIDEARVERLVLKENVADSLSRIKDEWAQFYTDLFEPYQKAVAAYAHGVRETPPGAHFSASNAARGVEQEINLLRNQLIRNYGHVVGRRPGPVRVQLWDCVGRLSDILAELGTDINQELPGRKDPVGKRIYANLGTTPLVRFSLHTEPGSVEFKPVVRQVQRYLEARHHAAIESIPRVAQLFLFEVLRGVTDMYEFLTNNEQSFLRACGRTIYPAGEEEAARWADERSGSTQESDRLQIRLGEQVQGDFIDTLTGLKTKNFFLEKLPALFTDARARKQPVSVLMVDIDHFKWVNDELGHQTGDKVLAASAATVLDGIRRGNDLAIRYGGEELMVVTATPLHSAVVLAERLRFEQAENLDGQPLYAPISAIAGERGEPCGSFSVGVAEAGSGETLEDLVGRADRALYQAKQTRNSVTVSRLSAHDTTLEPYQEYASRARGNAQP